MKSMFSNWSFAPSYACNYRIYIWNIAEERFPSDILVQLKVNLANVTSIFMHFKFIKKNWLWRRSKLMWSFILEWARFEPRIPCHILHITCYKFTPPNALDYQYQAADVSLKGGFYPMHCTLLCTWMPFVYARI